MVILVIETFNFIAISPKSPWNCSSWISGQPTMADSKGDSATLAISGLKWFGLIVLKDLSFQFCGYSFPRTKAIDGNM